MEMSEKLQALAKEKSAILHGNAERIAKQHADGKSTARERAAKLFDAGSWWRAAAPSTARPFTALPRITLLPAAP